MHEGIIAKFEILTENHSLFKIAENLHELAELKQWRKIIGMRNALMHDYLTIDSELLQQILAKKNVSIF